MKQLQAGAGNTCPTATCLPQFRTKCGGIEPGAQGERPASNPWTVVRPLLYMLMQAVSAVRLRGTEQSQPYYKHLNCRDAQASVRQEVMVLHSQAMRLGVFREEYGVNQNRPLDARLLFCESGNSSSDPLIADYLLIYSFLRS